MWNAFNSRTFDPDACPADIREELDRWGRGQQPWESGSFLTAVLQNDLVTALGKADPTNLRALPAIVSYCYNYLPPDSWGSKENHDRWLTAATERAREKRADA